MEQIDIHSVVDAVVLLNQKKAPSGGIRIVGRPLKLPNFWAGPGSTGRSPS